MRLSILLQILILLSIVLPAFAGLSPLALAAGEEIGDLKNQIDQKAKEIQELKEKEGEYSVAVNDAHEAADTLEEVVGGYNSQIRKVENDIYIKREEIISTTLQIRQKELAIDAQIATISRIKDYIAATLREINENDDEQISVLLFKYENFSEFFNQVEYRQLLQEELGVQLEEIGNIKKRLEEERGTLSIKNNELKDLKKDLESRNTILDSQKEQKENLLSETRSEEWRYKELLKETKERQEAIRREVFELEDKLRLQIDASSIPTARPGVLSWPTEGILTQRYGCTKFAKTSAAYPTCFHNGIDVGSGYGTIVRAALGGKVVAVQNAPYAYGKWIAIEHENGLLTMYAHLSLQSVSVGQKVPLGAIIGYMGSTGFSTGSHLHFTVYTASSFSTKPSKLAGTLPIGATINPFNYLP